MKLTERIRARVTIDENGCHVFNGARSKGYGRIALGSKAEGVGYTHRIMYAAANGPIPDGMHVDHVCRNRACCNPEHLEAVTQGENNRRAAAVRYPGVRGISHRPNLSLARPWRVEMSVNGRNAHLGLYATHEEAVAARLRAEVQQTADPERRKQIEAEVAALDGQQGETGGA